MGQVSFRCELDGKPFLEPLNWKGLKEVFEYGQNSNQPAIETQEFTFTGDACNYIYDHVMVKKLILKPIRIDVYYTQNDLSVTMLDNYIIDLTAGVNFKNNSFNNSIIPLEVDVKIKKRDGADYFLTEIQAITWNLLKQKGAYSASDLTTIKTVVTPIYNFVDIATAILAIYTLRKQIADIVQQAKQDVIDAAERIAGLKDPVAYAAAIAYIIITTAIKIAAYVILVTLLIKMTLDIINLLVPKVLNNKGITFLKGMQVICNFLGYDFVSNIPNLDKRCYMPSAGFSNGGNIIKDNLPNWYANTRGVPNTNDYGYVVVEFVQVMQDEFNARIDVIDGKVYLRNKFDKSLYKKGKFKPRIDLKYQDISPNITEIPHTSFFSYDVDLTDQYTTEYQENRFYEVKNISKYSPFKTGKFVESNLALGHKKTELAIIEKFMITLVSVSDQLIGLIGKNPNNAQKIKNNKTGILQVSQNNFNKPKIVAISNGMIPNNASDLVSARAKYSFYEGDSI